VNETPVEALGPAPFRFEPAGGAHEGAAFSLPFKAQGVALELLPAGWLASLWTQGKAPGGAVSILAWFLAALAMMAWTAWAIVRSRTRITADAVEQTWVWHKQLPIRELASARLVRVRGLEWLVAPRLYLRTLTGKFSVFYAADATLLAECERLARELTAFRKL
jgi:hypothetical protein